MKAKVVQIGARGFGFVKIEGEQIFLHASVLVGETWDNIRIGDELDVVVGDQLDGKRRVLEAMRAI